MTSPADLPPIWLALWIGLSILTLALLALMRTRWGQSRPLHKCAVLSLLAHLLLGLFATTVRIVADQQFAAGAVVQVTLVEDATARPASRGEEAANPAPWEVAEAAPAEPDSPAVDRADEQLNAQVERKPAMPEPTPGVQPQHAAASDPQPTADELEDAAPQRSPAQSAVAQEIDAPPARQQSDARVDLPEPAPQPQPQSVEATPAQPRRELQSKVAVDSNLPHMIGGERPDGAIDADTALLEPAAVRASQRPAPPIRPADSAAAAGNGPAEGAARPETMERAEVDPASMDQGEPAQPSADLPPRSMIRVIPPAAPQQIPEIYRHRTPGDRQQVLEQYGGDAQTEAAVRRALKWLAAAQAEDGRWDAGLHGAGHERRVLGHDRGHAGIEADMGITGLALLSFLGAGQTHLEGEHREVALRGLQYLLDHQGADGSLYGNARLFARMYCHGMAMLALCEAYAMTGDPRLRPAVERAVDFSVAAQDRVGGGWRYQPGDIGDTSQLGWQVMALRSAELGGMEVPQKTFDLAGRFLNQVASGRHNGLARYRPNQPVSRAMTGEAFFCRQILRQPIGPSTSAEAKRFLLGELPGEGEINLYGWYYTTLCLHQMQGDAWQQWNAALKTTLLRAQVRQGQNQGSWNTDTTWGCYGGRVYTTAMAALCLEVYYRYLPIYSAAGNAPVRSATGIRSNTRHR